MSLNTGSRGQSPMSSGRSSPQPRRRIDEDPTKKDPKYKRFSASIDRALALFESNNLQEWADYISFLGRLLKALQSHPSLPFIPSKSLVAQRLAQCLNSRLPSGVHQKTIEVYSYIFSLIGRDGLSADLALWTPGLTPVLSYASLTLKPHYLDLLERFYLPIGTALRPALKALVLALLPGIDEEGGEYFDKTLALIDAIRREVKDDAYFWQCVLLATITAPARRQGALVFLGRRLPQLHGASAGGADGDGKTDEERQAEAEALISPEPGLLVRAFCAGLRDEQLLVQRGFLDLLVTDIPLSSPVLQEKVSKADLELLVTSASGVVLRRDMSLNRRLWAWYLGPDEASSQAYFEKYGLQALVDGLSKMLYLSDAPPAERARPYRICLSLMDRWEVGSLVAPKLFLPAIQSLREYEMNAPSKETYGEVFRSASMFFDGVEAGLIWGQMLDKIKTAFSESGERATDHLQVVRFIIRTFNVREEEMVLVHAPMAVLAILRYLGVEPKDDSQELWRNGFLLAEEIWALVPTTAFKASASVPSQQNLEPSILDAIQNFYHRLQVRSSNGSIIQAPLQSSQAAELILKDVASAVQKAINGNALDVDIRCRLLVNILHKVPKLSNWHDVESLISSFLSKLQLDPVPFGALRGISDIVAALYSKGYLDIKDTDALVSSVTSGLWFYLSPDAPKFHVESVKALWNLQNALGDRRVEAAIATVMTSTSSPDAEPGRNFAVLWMHSVGGIGANTYNVMLTRPLFLFLDSLADDGLEISIFARGWLQTLPSINKLFWIFVEKLLGFPFLKDPGARDSDGAPRQRPIFAEDDCLEIATYYFQTLLNILRYSTNGMMAQLATELVVNGDERKAKALLQWTYEEEDMSLQTFFAKVAVRAIDGDAADPQSSERVSKLHKMALGVLQQLLLSPYSKPLADMELEEILTARLISTMDTKETYVQVALLEVLHEALKLSLNRPTSHLGHLRQLSRNSDVAKVGPRGSGVGIDAEKVAPPPQVAPPQQLLKCLIAGFSSPSSRPVLDSWIIFLGECLPLITDVIFQMVIPLVECLCGQIQATFESLKTVFQGTEKLRVPQTGGKSPESTLVALLNGLEQILAAAHARLLDEELKSVGPKSPDAPSGGFFGNMVSGVFSVENPQNRSAAANNRLTVLLCFQDTVKICYSIWSWSDASGNSGSLDTASKESWGYTSLRMKGRARRILEHMFAAETLECLETLIELWPGRVAPLGERTVGSIFRLVNVLDGSRPKHTIPAIFNAIYSRTNPAALDPSRRSTLTAELSDIDVVVFLVEYARSLEDDAMDEIWADCMVFLRDVLTNPFPHRQILPSLLSFTAILGEKVDNTNFGEQRKMRKELGDLFLRMLTAVFTVAPAGSRMLEQSASVDRDRMELDGESPPSRPTKNKPVPDDIVPILASIVPELRKVVVEPDRVITASVSISTSLIGPIFRSKSFPQNVSPALLDLIYQLTRLQNNQKAWRKELSEALLDQRFFLSPPALVKDKWVPLTKQLILADRERMTELLARITPPSAAGVLFGVGANSARQEADRKHALNLKRIAFLIFAAETDTFVPKLTEIEEKLVELLSATAVSSPSSATRGEVYLVLRALALRMSPVHLSSLWPLINSELHSALVALAPEGDPERIYSDATILHACKLLDLLLVLASDEFQLHEWLFVTDTIEAVYHPHDWTPMALVDQVVLEMQVPGSSRMGNRAYEIEHGGGRKPWFRGREEGQAEDVRRDVIAPFLRNLSIASYEGTYAMGRPDLEGCEDALAADLFEDAAL
ncbi:Dopey, N-terminal-domain-containing protein [Sphaerosporella brunnea]|uniref:Dopey, N-terminal-domain-containing protein n=1 Tax=Sphaerosporella brunnea TaxID=1250544 RepID=A0A5J5F1L4_9PEZI|nr:Dopey, N-terminal-domain-containing protein [Sphaerosporella brunnea]